MTDRDNPPLKPCPFCGGDAEVRATSYAGKPLAGARLFCTGCRFSSGDFYSEAAAVAAWNRRKEKPDAE